MSRVRLGELLESRGVCTREQLSAAWEHKVLYGDRLGTNLLALGHLDEAALAQILGEQHGVHAGHGDVLHVDPDATALLVPAVAIKRRVVPHHVAGRVLYLLMQDPENLRAIDDVRFATRLRVQPIVVCEARMWLLLNAHYGADVSLRPNPLHRRRPLTTTTAAVEAPDTEDLVSEEAFQSLYAGLASSPGKGFSADPDDDDNDDDDDDDNDDDDDDVSEAHQDGTEGPASPARTAASNAAAEALAQGERRADDDDVPDFATSTPHKEELQRAQDGNWLPPPPTPAPVFDAPVGLSTAISTGISTGIFDDATASPPDPISAGEAQAAPVGEVPTWQEDTRPMRLRLVEGMSMEDGDGDGDDVDGTIDIDIDMGGDGDDDDGDDSTLPLATTEASGAVPTSMVEAAIALEASDAGTNDDVHTLSDEDAAEAWQRSLEATNPLRATPKVLGLPELMLVEVVDEDPETLPPDAPSPFGDSRTNTSQIVPAPDLSPLSFDDAVAALQAVQERDGIARVVLRAARSRFQRAALLTVYPHAFVGWQGIGDGFEDLAHWRLDRDVESVFALVVESRAHYIGPLQRFSSHGAWVKATARKLPRSLAVIPILVRGRAVNLLVVDNGHDAHVDGDISEILILARHIAASYETLIAQDT